MKRFLLVSLFISFSFYSTAQLTEPKLSDPSLVSVQQAKALIFYPERSAPATANPLNNTIIPAEISAVVREIHVEVGEQVKKGALLASLDCRNYQWLRKAEKARTDALSYQLDFDARETKRGKKLAREKNIGDAELDRRKTQFFNTQAQLDAQQASLSLAQLNVKRCKVTAPYNGVITQRIASVGDMLDVGKPILKIFESDNINVSAKITIADMTSFQEASHYFFVNQTSRYPLSNPTIVPFIEANARSQEVRLSFINKHALAGSSGRLTWQTPTPYLPAHLLLKREDTYGFFIRENNQAKFLTVENAEEGRPIAYHHSFNHEIIIDGRHGLSDGDFVKVNTGHENNRSNNTSEQ